MSNAKKQLNTDNGLLQNNNLADMLETIRISLLNRIEYRRGAFLLSNEYLAEPSKQDRFASSAVDKKRR